MRYLLISLICCGTALAQSTVTIPAASPTVSGVVKLDGTTIKTNSSGQITSSLALPSGITFDGTTLTVPQLSAAQLTLTGGATPPDGLYVASMKPVRFRGLIC